MDNVTEASANFKEAVQARWKAQREEEAKLKKKDVILASLGKVWVQRLGITGEDSDIVFPTYAAYEKKIFHFTDLGKAILEGREKLERVAIPESIKVIGSGAFETCKCLEEVYVEGTLTSIGTHAFQGCDKLRTINLNKGLRNIGQFAFAMCRELEDIVIPEGIRTIGAYSFAGCSKLKKIVIPHSVLIVSNNAFFACDCRVVRK